MNTVGAYHAKTHLSDLLCRVQKGESVTITKHGVPVAVLVPPPAEVKPDPAEVIEAIKLHSKHMRLRGLSIREMIREGRR